MKSGYPPEASLFDAVFSRFGVMFFDDPVRAFANLRRSLRRGGRLGFVCWRKLDENELDHLPLRAAEPHLPPALVAQTASAEWFLFSEPDRIGSVLSDAGFIDVEVAPYDAYVGCGDLESTLEVSSEVGALGAILRAPRPQAGDHPGTGAVFAGHRWSRRTGSARGGLDRNSSELQ